MQSRRLFLLLLDAIVMSREIWRISIMACIVIRQLVLEERQLGLGGQRMMVSRLFKSEKLISSSS